MIYSRRDAEVERDRAPTAHLPCEVESGGRVYHKSGKVGHDIETGEASAEYETADGAATLWVDASGGVSL